MDIANFKDQGKRRQIRKHFDAFKCCFEIPHGG